MPWGERMGVREPKSIQLPEPSPDAAVEPRRTALEPKGQTSKRIAIVEDELVMAWSLEAMAEDLGHSVAGIFSTGKAALDGLQQGAWDLVFMDINLGGGIDGVETAQRLWAVRHVPVLFISAYGDSETKARVRELGPYAELIAKPVSTDSLRGAIERLALSSTSIGPSRAVGSLG